MLVIYRVFEQEIVEEFELRIQHLEFSEWYSYNLFKIKERKYINIPLFWVMFIVEHSIHQITSRHPFNIRPCSSVPSCSEVSLVIRTLVGAHFQKGTLHIFIFDDFSRLIIFPVFNKVSRTWHHIQSKLLSAVLTQ